jgi:hypothetical protein
MLIMKKILVVFLVLAVSTGVFAQGDWSIGAAAEITSRINIDPKSDPDATGNFVALAGGNAYHLYDWYGSTNGNVNIGYSIGILSAAITLHQLDFIGATVTVENTDGPIYKFQADSNLNDIIAKKASIGRLWGYYKLANGMVHLEAAFNSDAVTYWDSDVTGAFGGSLGNEFQDLFKDGGVFAGFDHHNYLLANFSISSLEFGLVVPNLFLNGFATEDNQRVYGYNASSNSKNGGWVQDWGGSGNWAWKDIKGNLYPSATPAYADKPTTTPSNADLLGMGVAAADLVAGDGYVRLIDQVLKNMIFGVKFDMSPIEFAAQLLMDNYSVYLGAKYFAGPATIGFSFMGELNNPNSTHMKAGLSVGYNAGSFGAGFRGKLENSKNKKNDGSGTLIGVEPDFFYMAIPTHLQFNLAAGFYFASGTENDGTKIAMETYWGIQPQLVWNFMGTGSGWGSTSGIYDGYYMINTGMLFRYRMYSGNIRTNALDVTFKFGM